MAVEKNLLEVTGLKMDSDNKDLSKTGFENITTGDFKKVDDQSYISHLFRNISKEKNTPVLIDCGFTKFYAQMYVQNHKDDFVSINKDIETDNFENKIIKVAFIFKEEFIVFESNVLDNINNTTFLIQKPKLILSSLRRLLSRYKFNNNEFAQMQLPVSKFTYRLLDISTKGLSFFSYEPIKENSVFSNINININNEVEFWVDGCIKYCLPNNNFYICGLAFLDSDWGTFDKIFNYIYKKNYPNLKPLFDFDLNKIYSLFLESGYLDLKSKKEMDLNFKEMAKSFNFIKNKSQLSMNVGYVHNGKLFSTASLLRVYNRTFLGHQLAAVPESRMNLKTKTDIYLSFADFLLNHPYCQYYLTYFNASSLWHNQMYKKIDKYIDNENNSLYDWIQLFECDKNALLSLESQLVCQQLVIYEGFLQYCRDNLHKLEMESYSFNDDFKLEEIKQVFELVGLYIDRKLWGVFEKDKIVAFVVSEVFSPGLNLYNLLDMSRFYIVNKNIKIDEVIRAVLPDIKLFYSRYNKDRFNLLIKIDDEAAEALSISGVKYSHRMGRFILNSKGISAYKKFFMLNI